MTDTQNTPPQVPADFRPPRPIDSLGQRQPWTQWDDDFDHNSGISGLFIIEDNTIVVDNRSRTHHNDQLRNLLDSDVYDRSDPKFGTIMAWSQGYREDWSDDTPDSAQQSDLELPRSGGGLTQAFRRLDLKGDTDAVQHGGDVSARVLWPVVWTCRLLGIHADTTVRFSHAADRHTQPDPETDGHTVIYDGDWRVMASPVERVFPLSQAYQELRFEDMLPDEHVSRDFSVSEPDLFNPPGGVT